jgi:hypothetical protein
LPKSAIFGISFSPFYGIPSRIFSPFLIFFRQSQIKGLNKAYTSSLDKFNATDTIILSSHIYCCVPVLARQVREENSIAQGFAGRILTIDIT